MLYFLSISTVEPLVIVYKEGTDRMLILSIQVTSLYWNDVITNLCYSFVFENDTTSVASSQTVVQITGT